MDWARASAAPGTAGAKPSISVVVLTYNRLDLLRRCVDNVLRRTSSATGEIVIWNNASTDGTVEYLDSLDDPRFAIVHHPQNVGQNGYALAFARARFPYLVELDDDIIDAPPDWDLTLLESFKRLPGVGFLAANLVENELDETASLMYGANAHLYRIEDVNGVRLKLGPTGGGCSMTSRELYDRVGGFRQKKGEVFWLEDAAYIEDIRKLGLEAAYIEDLKVFHAGGAHYSAVTPEKAAYWNAFQRRLERKWAVKRFLLALPFVRWLNERFGWFEPPPRDPPNFGRSATSGPR